MTKLLINKITHTCNLLAPAILLTLALLLTHAISLPHTVQLTPLHSRVWHRTQASDLWVSLSQLYKQNCWLCYSRFFSRCPYYFPKYNRSLHYIHTKNISAINVLQHQWFLYIVLEESLLFLTERIVDRSENMLLILSSWGGVHMRNTLPGAVVH